MATEFTTARYLREKVLYSYIIEADISLYNHQEYKTLSVSFVSLLDFSMHIYTAFARSVILTGNFQRKASSFEKSLHCDFILNARSSCAVLTCLGARNRDGDVWASLHMACCTYWNKELGTTTSISESCCKTHPRTRWFNLGNFQRLLQISETVHHFA